MIKITLSIENAGGKKISVEKEYAGTTDNYCIDEIEILMEHVKTDMFPEGEKKLLTNSREVHTQKKT